MTPDSTEGELTELDAKIISTIKSEFKRPEEIAEITGFPLPEIMKRLRELVADEMVAVINAKYISFSGKQIQQILEALESRPLTLKEISERLSLPVDFVETALYGLIKADKIYKANTNYISFEYRRKWYSKKRHQLKWISIELVASSGLILSGVFYFHSWVLLIIGMAGLIVSLCRYYR